MKNGIRIAIMTLFSVKEWSRDPSFRWKLYLYIFKCRTIFDRIFFLFNQTAPSLILSARFLLAFIVFIGTSILYMQRVNMGNNYWSLFKNHSSLNKKAISKLYILGIAIVCMVNSTALKEIENTNAEFVFSNESFVFENETYRVPIHENHKCLFKETTNGFRHVWQALSVWTISIFNFILII